MWLAFDCHMCVGIEQESFVHKSVLQVQLFRPQLVRRSFCRQQLRQSKLMAWAYFGKDADPPGMLGPVWMLRLRPMNICACIARFRRGSAEFYPNLLTDC